MNCVSRLVAGLCLVTILSGPAAAQSLAVKGYATLGGADDQMIHRLADDATAAKAEVDTFLLMGPGGSGAPYVGSFENGEGEADWNGWISRDESEQPVRWHASPTDPLDGLYSAWCGEVTTYWTGYGNNYHEILEWRGQVDDPMLPCQVTIDAVISYNVEPDYDSCRIGVTAADGNHDLWFGDGPGNSIVISETFTYHPGDYVGDLSDEVVVYFLVLSDASYSDADGDYTTSNPVGAMKIDQVGLTLDNGTGAAHDFEDGTLGPFTPRNISVGDFAKIWTGLADLDACRDNPTPQVAFIDDGIVVPGTGGSLCLGDPFCYGPDNYIVNATGGLRGDAVGALNNAIISPVMPWPDATHDGISLALDVYTHSNPTWAEALIVWTWSVRYTTDPDPGTLEQEAWITDDWLWYGGPGYERREKVFDFAIGEIPTYIQVKLNVQDVSPLYDITSNTTSPGPYLDNVRVSTYPSAGPYLALTRANLAQDGFPQTGAIDPEEPSASSVRFDAAVNRAAWPAIAPGDSVVVGVLPRGGAELLGTTLNYHLDPNPLFDTFRSSGLPNIGSVPCAERGYWKGLIRFSADLPDTGFLYPGDVLHYYFSATDQGSDTKTAVLPDTTGFGDFGPRTSYPLEFTVRALPSVADVGLSQPSILFWNDYISGAAHRLWIEALQALGFECGVDFDVYYTHSASTGEGNGLGGRATPGLLRGYDTILYTSGSLATMTLGTPTCSDCDPGGDLELLDMWLNEGTSSKFLFLTGDHLASDMSRSYVGNVFLEHRVGVSVDGDDVGAVIGSQRSPHVVESPYAYAPFWTDPGWYLDGECPAARTFDAVMPYWADFLSAFTEAGGDEIVYTYAAATRYRSSDGGYEPDAVVFLPYGLSSTSRIAVGGDKLDWGPHVNILSDVLTSFSHLPTSSAPTPRSGRLRIVSHPNPFNPTMEVAYSVPGRGRLEITIYDVAGRRVTTLMDRVVQQDGKVSWNGVDEMDRRVASGVYFCRASFGEASVIRKIMMIK